MPKKSRKSHCIQAAKNITGISEYVCSSPADISPSVTSSMKNASCFDACNDPVTSALVFDHVNYLCSQTGRFSAHCAARGRAAWWTKAVRVACDCFGGTIGALRGEKNF